MSEPVSPESLTAAREWLRHRLVHSQEDIESLATLLESYAAAREESARRTALEEAASIAMQDFDDSMKYPDANRWDDSPATAKRIETRIRALAEPSALPPGERTP